MAPLQTSCPLPLRGRAGERVTPLPATEQNPLPTGVAAIDAVLPGGGLRRGGLHLFGGAPADPAALGLATVLAGMLGGPVVWIRLQHRRQEDGLPYPYGLAALGLDPHRLVLVEPDRAADGFWALEEALRSGCAGAVLAEGLHPDLTQQRRLQLAAERGSAPALLVNVGRPAKASAASTQWNVASVPGTAAAGLAAGPLQPMPAAPRWSATLQRCRGARTPQSWIIERQPGTGLVEIVPVLPVRQPQPPQPAATAASLAPAGLLRRTG